ncbi:hypothetical protein [Streptomyces sp. NRRL S-118]|uniref:hypothetical protein n=1 Tax=Streptomyces sp. NRRL S-118 TaxID=1463881 RepID=UPI000AD46622|nr:hypothetical protein [Streptomyces sp. NRRL S-118]
MAIVLLVGTLHSKAPEYGWLRDGLRGSAVEVVGIGTHIDDPAFGHAASGLLHRTLSGAPAGRVPTPSR